MTRVARNMLCCFFGIFVFDMLSALGLFRLSPCLVFGRALTDGGPSPGSPRWCSYSASSGFSVALSCSLPAPHPGGQRALVALGLLGRVVVGFPR